MKSNPTRWLGLAILTASLALNLTACGGEGGSGGGGAADTGAGKDAGVADTSKADAAASDTSGGADAGPQPQDTSVAGDAGMGGTDAGPGGDDAGSGGSDAGSGGDDAGSGGSDAGSGGTDAGPVGCSAGQFQDPTDSQCKEASCKAMSEALYASISAALASSNDCKQDTDCVMASTGTACQGTCGAPIHKDHEAAFKAKIDAIDAAVCKATGYPGKCGYSTPGCMQPKPGCEKGKCVYNKVPAGGCQGQQPANTVCTGGVWVCKEGTMQLPGSGACVEPTCKAVSDSLQGTLGELLFAGGKCTQDTDCTTVSVSIACWGACPAAVNVAHKADVEAMIQAHDAICKAADYANKCGYMTPKCMAPDPGCHGGVCVYNKSM